MPRNLLKYTMAISLCIIIIIIIIFTPFTQPANVISNEYITISVKTYNNGDMDISISILVPQNIQINSWASWVRFADGSESEHKIYNSSIGYSYSLTQVSPQIITAFLQINGQDLLLENYFVDIFSKTWNHNPSAYTTTEITSTSTTTSTTELVTTSTTAKATYFTPFAFISSLIAILSILIIKRKFVYE